MKAKLVGIIQTFCNDQRTKRIEFGVFGEWNGPVDMLTPVEITFEWKHPLKENQTS
jgi:hypothetical protein